MYSYYKRQALKDDSQSATRRKLFEEEKIYLEENTYRSILPNQPELKESELKHRMRDI